jgi:hypothetical protein
LRLALYLAPAEAAELGDLYEAMKKRAHNKT